MRNQLFFFVFAIFPINKIFCNHDLLEYADNRISRKRRAKEDVLTVLVDQMASTARLVTAISLQNCIIDGSFSPEEVLAELMNMPSEDLAKLEDFDKAEVEAFIQMVNGLNITETRAMNKMETMILELDSWRRMFEDVGDLTDLTIAKKYNEQVNEIADEDPRLVDALSTVNVSIGGLATFFRKTRDLPDSIDASNKSYWLSVFEDVPDYVGNLEEFISNPAKVLFSLELLASRQFQFELPASKFIRLLYEYAQKSSSMYNASLYEQKEVVSVIQHVSKSLADSGPAAFSTLGSFVRRGVTPRNYTSGFLNGHSDIAKVDGDARKTSLWSPTTSQTGLEPLNSLNDGIEEVKKKWKRLFDAQSVNVSEKIREMGEQFRVLETLGKSSPADSIAKVSELHSPITTGNLVILKSPLTHWMVSIVLNDAIVQFLDKIQSSSFHENLKQLLVLREVIDFDLARNKNPDNAEYLVDQFKKFNDTEKCVQILKTLEPLIQECGPLLEKMHQSIETLKQVENVSEAFIRDPETQKYVKFFTLLKDMQELEPLATSLKLIRALRILPSDAELLKRISEMSVAVESSLPSFKHLVSIPAMIRNNQEPRVEELQKLDGLEKDAKDFGDAVKALDNIRRSLESEDDFGQFIEGGREVEVGIANETDLWRKMEMEDQWGDFVKTREEIEYLLKDLKQKTSNIRNLKTAMTVTDYFRVFKGVAPLRDMNLRIPKRRKVLEMLGVGNQTKDVFDRLESLDLEFAKFNKPLNGIAITLKNIDAFFRKLMSVGKPPSNPPKNPRSPLVSKDPSTTKAPMSIAKIVFLIILAVVGIAVVAGFCVVVCHSFRNTDKPKTKKTSKENGTKRIVPQAGSPKREKGRRKKNKKGSGSRTSSDEKGSVEKGSNEKGSNEKGSDEKGSNEDAPEKIKEATLAFGADGKPYWIFKAVAKNENRRISDFLRNHCWDNRIKNKPAVNNAFPDLLHLNLNIQSTLMAQWFDSHTALLPVFEGLLPHPNRSRAERRNFVLVTQPDFGNSVASNWFPANFVTYPLHSRVIVAEGPIDGTTPGKTDNRAAFWGLVFRHESPHIVMVCGMKEIAEYFPASLNSPRPYGQYQVTVISMDLIQDGEVKKREIEVMDTEMKTRRRLKHWSFTNWTEKSARSWLKAPVFLKALIFVIRETRLTKKPILVHGRLGTGRSGVFVLIEYIFQALMNLNIEVPLLLEMLENMRRERYGLIDNGYQLFFSLLAGCTYFDEQCRNKFYPGMLEANWKALDDYYQISGTRNIQDVRDFGQFKDDADGMVKGSERSNRRLSSETIDSKDAKRSKEAAH